MLKSICSTCMGRPGRRVPNVVLKFMLSAVLAVTMILASGITAAPVFGAEKTEEELNTFDYKGDIRLQHQNVFGFPKGKELKKLKAKAKSYPDAFDLRNVDTDKDGKGDTSYVTPVRVQNPYGTCWGFAAVAAAESSLLSSGLAGQYGLDVNTLDLSEKQISYFVNTFIDDPDSSQYGEGTHFKNLSKKDKENSAYKYDTGGMTYNATALFASGVGVTQEMGENDPLYYCGRNKERTYWEVATKYLRKRLTSATP